MSPTAQEWPAGKLPELVDTAATRNTLHALAEHTLAAEQFAANDELALAVVPHGFATNWFPAEDGPRRISVEGDQVVHESATGEIRESISGAFEPAAANVLYAWWALGDRVLRTLEPADGESISPVVLWPEHFDIAVTLTTADGRSLNLGFSPGDDFSALPYVYAGPWEVPAGEFWNAPFGAWRSFTEIAAGDPFAKASAFLEQARAEFGRSQ